jgi:hypothetical protein
VVPCHKVHLYFLLTVLKAQHNTCPYYLLSEQTICSSNIPMN